MPDHSHLPPWLWPRAAYIHIPFCAHHCGYCDFAVTAGRDELIDLYVEALGEEIARLGTPAPVDTIFLGGGTPTYLGPEPLRRLLETVNRWLPLRAGGEFSIEATPESITSAKVGILTDHGVNRVSLGVQTFRPDLLRQLDRIHMADHIGPAIDRIRSRIDNVSLDLIFGIPEQSLSDWDSDLTAALNWNPDHLSTYGLTYEKGTPLWKQRSRGAIRPVTEDDELAMFERSMDRLAAAGLEKYEETNNARPDRRCRNNELYCANES
jgi:oxygen-independent coproporphyrinogen-3 oxidase